MALFLWFFTSIDIPWIILVFLCPFIYSAVLLLMKTFEPSEKALFLSMLKFRNLHSLITGRSKP